MLLREIYPKPISISFIYLLNDNMMSHIVSYNSRLDTISWAILLSMLLILAIDEIYCQHISYTSECKRLSLRDIIKMSLNDGNANKASLGSHF